MFFAAIVIHSEESLVKMELCLLSSRYLILMTASCILIFICMFFRQECKDRGSCLMNRENRKKYRRNSALACLLIAALAGAGIGQRDLNHVYADDIADGIDSDESSDISQGGGSLSGPGDGGLFEDSGEEVQNTSGVDMDDLQKAIKSGDTDALRRYANQGALTDPGNTTKGSGIGSGAYRGMPGENTGSGEDAGGGEEDNGEDDSGKNIDLDEDPDAETELVEKIGTLDASDPDLIDRYLSDLSEYDSITGSDGELKAADYIMQKMESFGYTVQTQDFHEGTVGETGKDEQGLNILAERGADSRDNRTQDIFLVVTHYDNARDKEGNLFAEDKTGVCALLEAGRILSSVVTDTDICFVFLSGEADGLFGSMNFINSLSDENKSRITGVLDVERVGYDPETVYTIATLDGEPNAVGDLIQNTGIQYDRLMEQEDAEDDGNDIQLDAADGLSAEDGAEAEETESEEELPEKWSYIEDAGLSHTTFAQDSLTAAALTQYFPQSMLDAALEEQEDQTESDEEDFEMDETEGMYAEDETEEDFFMLDSSVPVPDSYLIAEASDVLAKAVSSVMDPNS